jgi:hypothetical protein
MLVATSLSFSGFSLKCGETNIPDFMASHPIQGEREGAALTWIRNQTKSSPKATIASGMVTDS